MGTRSLTGKRFKKGAEGYCYNGGYAKFVAPAPKGWYYAEGEHELGVSDRERFSREPCL